MFYQSTVWHVYKHTILNMPINNQSQDSHGQHYSMSQPSGGREGGREGESESESERETIRVLKHFLTYIIIVIFSDLQLADGNRLGFTTLNKQYMCYRVYVFNLNSIELFIVPSNSRMRIKGKQ